MSDIFDSKLLEKSTVLKFKEPHTSLLINNGTKGFQLKPLPIEAQVSPAYGIETLDLNNDGFKDIILGGNLYAVKPEVGRYDALFGLVLLGNGKSEFKAIPSSKSGLSLAGEIRHIALLNSKKSSLITIVRNNNSMKFFSAK